MNVQAAYMQIQAQEVVYNGVLKLPFNMPMTLQINVLTFVPPYLIIMEFKIYQVTEYVYQCVM